MQIYCPSLSSYNRWKTKRVMVGDIGIGGEQPIRIQSMTTTNTLDTDQTVLQAIRMIRAGCEIIRITAPSIKEAKNLKTIKKRLRSIGYRAPIVADIHFTPHAAEIAAKIVEKVRINPGNYADRKKFEQYVYTEKSYNDELERIRDRFKPLVSICKKYGTAMRIGTNHGSLSDRIMSRYGDTPLGMVESAMEFIRIAEDEGFYDIILSMKASNTQVMVQAYRLLVQKMVLENMNYPLHLGVTEAGEGEDGRIKSAVGIGTLLEDGLGDTIRVSLTEEPEAEIPVAQILVNRYQSYTNQKNQIKKIKSLPYDPFFYKRKTSKKILSCGGNQVPIVIGDLSQYKSINYHDLGQFGYLYSKKNDKWHVSDIAIDFLYIGLNTLNFEVPGILKIIVDKKNMILKKGYYQVYSKEQINQISPDEVSFVKCKTIDDISDKINSLPNSIIILESEHDRDYMCQRRSMIDAIDKKILNPIIIKKKYRDLTAKNLLIHSAIDIGALQIDGFGDGIWIDSDHKKDFLTETSFNILQACRTRISKTEYISCPSCGRTLFDLQKTTAKIRSKTEHLKGIKIGVMGCIVNGPGEMADADYGYVGTGPGMISLYKGQKVIKRNISDDKAVDALINLIDEHGDWIEPSNV